MEKISYFVLGMVVMVCIILLWGLVSNFNENQKKEVTLNCNKIYGNNSWVFVNDNDKIDLDYCDWLRCFTCEPKTLIDSNEEC